MKSVWIVCGVVLAGVLTGWLASGRRASKPASSTVVNSAASDRSRPVVWAPPRQPVANTLVPAGYAMPETTNTPTQQNQSTNWEDQVGQLLVADMDEAEKGRELLEIFRNLPLEGQVQLAEQLSFLLGDEEYATLGAYLTDPSQPGPLLDALLSGVLVRSDQVRASLLLAVAQNEQHPKAAEARRLLEGLLGQDLTADQSQWAGVVQQWLETARLETASGQ